MAADTRKGRVRVSRAQHRPMRGARSLSNLSRPHRLVTCGRFGADMKVTLTNDGPMTFWLQVPPGNS